MTNTEFNHRMEDILTPEQYARFDEIRKQKQQQRQQQAQTQSSAPNNNDYKPNSGKNDWDDVYK